MKIAITSQGKELSSKITPRFGRTEFLIFLDDETDGFEINDNTVNSNAASGAGIQTAQNIVKSGAEAVITGNIGPNAFKTLQAAKIKVFLSKASTVQEALILFKEGKLQEVTEPNVEGHWI